MSESDRNKVRALAKDLSAESRFDRERGYFEPFARRGLGHGSMTVLGDVREIPLLTRRSSRALEYRLSTLAQAGDLVVIGTERNRGFEDYRAQVLKLGGVEYLDACPPNSREVRPTAVLCLADGVTYAELASRVRERNGTTLLPHITTGTVWALARKLGQDTGFPIRVAGPLPTLSRVANNKIWFSRVARSLFGPQAVPVEVPAHGAAALTGKVRSLARKNNRLVIKVPDSAGSAGNFVVDCASVRNLGVRGTHGFLSALLEPADGGMHFPLMVQIWENRVLTSPSIQIWIPDPKDGLPIIEGIYEQVLSGPGGAFAGAAQADLPAELDERMAREGLILAAVFQELGYYGRCSFDAVISGDDFTTARLLWIECNGRWGGVSVPMTFLNMQFRDTEVPAFVIHHAPGADLRRQSFADAVERVRHLLWSPGRAAGLIFLTPSGFETGGNLHFVSLESTVELARDKAEAAITLLAGPP